MISAASSLICAFLDVRWVIKWGKAGVCTRIGGAFLPSAKILRS